MEIVIVGNGILGLMTAHHLLQRDSSLTIKIIGPALRQGSATLAAAAMFNSFCEIEGGTLRNKIEKQKFEFNRLSNSKWPILIKKLEEQSKTKIEHGFGTFLINNHISDSLEDENFDAIHEALNEYHESFEIVLPKNIPNFKPSAGGRASRALFIPKEGWINPTQLLAALEKILRDDGVTFIDGSCEKITQAGREVSSVVLGDKEEVKGDIFLLSPGAVFSKIMAQSDLNLDMPKIYYGIGCSVLLKTSTETLKNCVRTPNRGLACGIYAAPQDSSTYSHWR